jgi:hypothetical protein
MLIKLQKAAPSVSNNMQKYADPRKGFSPGAKGLCSAIHHTLAVLA